VTDLATLTAILYAGSLQRRTPETNGEKQRAIAAAMADARLIVAATIGDGTDIRRTLSRLLETDTPEQPPPPPGTRARRIK
jgi:hypothetical protein